MYVIKNIDPNDYGWYIANWKGDPGRTKLLTNVKLYKSLKSVKSAISYYNRRYSNIRKMELIPKEIKIKEIAYD